MIDYHKSKYHEYYWGIVDLASQQSVANRQKIGAVMVLPNGLIATGWNGMPSGSPNACEVEELALNTRTNEMEPMSNPAVVHAEHNVIKKLLSAGLSTEGAILFVSRVPCAKCTSLLTDIGLKAIYYEHYSPKNTIDVLIGNGIEVIHSWRKSHEISNS